jgi:hypothetical protein
MRPLYSPRETRLVRPFRSTDIHGKLIIRQDSRAMYLKLKRFTSDRKASRTSSSFGERFQFFKDEKNRDVCIKNLQKWNKVLERVLRRAIANTDANTAVTMKRSPSLLEMKILFDALIQTLGHHWCCNCSSPHEAMLCISVFPSETRLARPNELEFDILIRDKSGNGTYPQWLESTILVQSKRSLCKALVKASTSLTYWKGIFNCVADYLYQPFVQCLLAMKIVPTGSSSK